MRHVSADATDSKDISACKSNATGEPLQYRALVALKTSHLERDGRKLKPAPGMQVNAEIVLAFCTCLS